MARKEAMDRLKARGDELMESTICQKRDLEWETTSIFRSLPRVMTGLLFRRKPRSG
jgi:hypothetical protein